LFAREGTSSLKYAVLFAFAGALLGLLAASHSGWYLLLLWPALSLIAISLAYFGFGTRVFGKRLDGRMTTSSLIVLFPYLAYLWSVWHVLRIVSREDCQNRLADNLTIGRRMLANEMPEYIEVVVDLTCEFFEPKPIRTSREYLSFPLLDGVAPSPESIVRIARQLSEDGRHIFIHCAQGHGRTGLVAAALIVIRGTAADPGAAIELLQSARPQVRLSRGQMSCLERAFLLMREAGCS
jgi:protein-tyrosine phosphatase